MIKIAFFIVILLYIEIAYIVPSGLYFIVRSEGTPPSLNNTKVILSFREPKKKAPLERSPKNPRLETRETGTPP
jgi:hypothetical protein